MRIVAFSDLHAHPYASGVVAGQENFRLANCMTALRTTLEAAREKQCPLFFGGDLTHAKEETPISVINALYDLFEEFSDVKVCAITGNHDAANKSGSEHTLKTLRGFIRVFDKPVYEFYAGEEPFHLYAVPFIRDPKELAEAIQSLPLKAEPVTAPRVLLAHTYVRELMRKHENIETQDLALSFFAEHFDICLLGHHHRHDVVQVQRSSIHVPCTVVSLGSPIQHTFGDAGDKRGYCVIDTGSRAVELVEIANVPKFVVAESPKELTPETAQNNFVRVTCTKKAEVEAVQKKVEATGALKVTIERVPEAAQARITGLRPSMDDMEVFRKYRTHVKPDGAVRPVYLDKLAEKYLKEN